MQLTRHKSERRERLVGVEPPPWLPAAPGVEQMFVEIFRRVAPRAIQHARRFLSREDARDALSSAIEKAWRQWKHLTPEQMSDAYLYRAVHHEIVLIYRRNKRIVGLDDATAELAQLAIGEIDAFTRATTAEEVLDLVIAAMPEARRNVMLLVQRGMTHREVAEHLQITRGTVSRHALMANEEIRAAFRNRGFRLARGAPGKAIRLLPPGRSEGPNV